MKRIVSMISLFGLTILACNAISQIPTSETGISATPTSAPVLSQPSGGNEPGNSTIQNFSLDNVNSILPEDVGLEVVYLGHGGPGDEGFCKDENGVPYSEPAIVDDPVDNELMVRSTLTTCGWKKNQELQGIIGYPDGEEKSYSLFADEMGVVTLSFAPNLDDPEGIYTFNIYSDTKKLESNAFFYTPTVPRLYYLGETQLLFHKFPPGEEIQLYMFIKKQGFGWETKGGMSFVIGDTGDLTVVLPKVSNSVFIGKALGLPFDPIDNFDTSHSSLHSYWNHFFGLGEDYFERLKNFNSQATSYRACADTIASTFSRIDDENSLDHETAKIITSNTSVFSQPRYTARIEQKAETGQVIKLMSGPYCFDNTVWWGIVSPNYDGEGYITEFEKNNEQSLEKQECGDLPSRLSRFHSARVAHVDGSNTRIRKSPGFSSEKVTSVPEGTVVQLTGDSWCVDSSPWWPIQTTDQKITGWMTEIQNGVYLLEP